MFLRQDQFFVLTFNSNVPWDDMTGWQAFIDYANTGGSFLYYPDDSASRFDEYWLEDGGGSARNSSVISAWNPRMGARMLSSFELTLRKVPGGLSGL